MNQALHFVFAVNDRWWVSRWLAANQGQSFPKCFSWRKRPQFAPDPIRPPYFVGQDINLNQGLHFLFSHRLMANQGHFMGRHPIRGHSLSGKVKGPRTEQLPSKPHPTGLSRSTCSTTARHRARKYFEPDSKLMRASFLSHFCFPVYRLLYSRLQICGRD